MFGGIVGGESAYVKGAYVTVIDVRYRSVCFPCGVIAYWRSE